MEITSTEFKEYSDQLSDDWYFDGDVEIPDSFIKGEAAPDEILSIETGDVSLVYQGNDETKYDTIIDLVDDFKKWQKAKTHKTLIVTIKNADVQKLKTFIKSIGGSIK